MFEAQSKVVDFFIRIQVVADFGKTVLHLVPVVPTERGGYQTLVKLIDVVHLSNAPVQIEGR